MKTNKYSIVKYDFESGHDNGLDYSSIAAAKKDAKELIEVDKYETVYITTYAWGGNEGKRAVLWVVNKYNLKGRRPYRSEIENMITKSLHEEFLRNSPYLGKV